METSLVINCSTFSEVREVRACLAAEMGNFASRNYGAKDFRYV